MTIILVIVMIVAFGFWKFYYSEPFLATKWQVLAWVLAAGAIAIAQVLLGMTPLGPLGQWISNVLGVAFVWFASGGVQWLMVRCHEAWHRFFPRCPSCDSTEVTTERLRDIFEGTAPNGVLVRLTAKIDMHTCCNCRLQYTGAQAERARTTAWEKFLKHGDTL